MQPDILIITSLESAEDAATSVAAKLGFAIEVAPDHRSGLAALRRRDYSIVVLDQSIAEANPSAAEQVWDNARLAVPLQVNFAICGAVRLAREIRGALARRKREETLAMAAVTVALESELKTAVSGLLLQSQLAQAEPSHNPRLAERLKMIAGLAAGLRNTLTHPANRIPISYISSRLA